MAEPTLSRTGIWHGNPHRAGKELGVTHKSDAETLYEYTKDGYDLEMHSRMFPGRVERKRKRRKKK